MRPVGTALAAFAALLALGQSPVEAGKPVVPPGRDPGGVAVALIGTGIDYTLPHLRERLARDGEGELVGWDFVDDDRLPYEAAPAHEPLPPEPSGTALATIIATQAPEARLVPLRRAARSALSLGQAMVHAARSPARITVVPFAHPDDADWDVLRQVAGRFSSMLFIVAAGEDGNDLDANPAAAAALRLDNVLSVTAADATGRLLPSANFGLETVDLAVPAVAVPAIGPGGPSVRISGTAAGAARVAALAARIEAAEPQPSGAASRQRVLALVAPAPGERRTRAGWIAEPAGFPSP